MGAFLMPVFPAMLGIRWFRSRKVHAPVAKSLGAIWLLMFVPALLAIFPGHVRWMNCAFRSKDCLAALSATR